MKINEQINFLKLAEKLAGLGHWYVDLENDALFWSEEIFRIHGVNPADYTPTIESAVDFYHPEDREPVSKLVEKAIKEGTPFEFSLRLVRADNSVRHVRSKAECNKDDSGKVSTIFGIFQDITEEVLKKEQIEKTETAHKTFIDATGDGYWDWYIQDDYEYMSPRFWEMFGYLPEEKPHNPSAWQDMIFEEDLQLALKNFNEHVNTLGEHPYEQEVRYRHKNGSTVTVLCRGKVVEWDDQNQPIRMIGTHTDITELKEKTQNLEKALSFEKLLLNTNTDLIFVKDKDFRIVQANDAFLSLYPEKIRDSVIGTTTIEEYPPEQAEAFLAEDKKAFKEGFSEIIEQIDFPDGKRCTLLTKKIRFEDTFGESFILCTARDITELKKTEQALVNANAELEEFAYRTSHDLRSPLISSTKLLSIINEKLQAGEIEKAISYLPIVQGSLEKLETLVTDILSLARLNHGEDSIREIKISTLIEESLRKFAYMDGYDRIRFITQYNYDEPIKAHKAHLTLVVENLLSNAIKYQDYNKAESIVTCSIEIKEGKLSIIIQDNGLGIPEEYQEKLFSMFKRFHANTAYGSGLGLYMVKKSIDKIGGSIVYLNTGEGSQFTITLPINTQ